MAGQLAVRLMVMGVHLDELDRVVGDDRLRTLPLRVLEDRRYGGEWDWRRNMDRRTHRRLVGAGWLVKGGELPDVMASHLIIPRLPGVDDTCSAIDWYLRCALRSIKEARRASHTHRHLRYARARGHKTYYAYRTQQALDAGHRSLWHMRQDKGWT